VNMKSSLPRIRHDFSNVKLHVKVYVHNSCFVHNEPMDDLVE